MRNYCGEGIDKICGLLSVCECCLCGKVGGMWCLGLLVVRWMIDLWDLVLV